MNYIQSATNRKSKQIMLLDTLGFYIIDSYRGNTNLRFEMN